MTTLLPLKLSMRRRVFCSYLIFFIVLPTIVRCVPNKNYTRQYLLSTLEEGRGGLLWHDLAVTSQQDGSVILPSFTGHVQNGKLCGILGPSGAGKSTFLLTLAGLQTLPKKGQVWNYVMGKDSNLELHHVVSHHVAWLQQEDVFFNMLTVRETLELAAYLELPFSTQHEREQLVQSQLSSLGLAHAADRQVGSTFGGASRLSGGERRRLSVALELLTEKEIFIADEPTSGLDSSMSIKVINLIKDLAVERNIPCFCTLHQPRSSIWHALDNLILMGPGGRVCYSGPKEEAIEYFKDIGYPCPEATNPAEFFVDLVSVDTEDPEEAAKDEKRLDDLTAAFREYQREWSKYKKRHSKDVDVSVSREGNGQLLSVRQKILPVRWVSRMGALLRRSWRQNIRNQSVNIFRLCASAVNAVLLAQIFPTVRGPIPTANSVADRVALLSFGAINMCFIAFMKTITLISEEKPVVQREQTRHHYSALEYILAKVIAELPLDCLFVAVFTKILKQCSGVMISWKKLTTVFSLLTTAGASLGLMLGSWVPSSELSTTASIPVLVILMVVGIINPSGVDPNKPPPAVVKLMKQFSPFSYAIEALCLGEYPGMQFARKSGWFQSLRRFGDLPRMGGLAMVKNGDQVIEALGLKDKTFNGALEHLGMLSVGYLACSWFGLLFQQHHQNFRFRPENGKRRSGIEQRLSEREPNQIQSWPRSDSAERRIQTTNKVRL